MIRLAAVAFLAFVSSSIALTAGCGGATTEPGAERPNEDRRPVGPSVPTNGSLTEECGGEKGLTGQSVLDKLAIPESAVFRRFPPDKPYGYTDPATSTHTTIRVHYEGGDVRCSPGGDTSGARMNPSIVTASVAVVVSVELRTDDGLFDEHIQAELSSTSAGTQTITLGAVIPVGELAGSYRKTAESDALGSGVPMKVTGTFAKGDLAGSEGSVDHGERFVGLFRFDW